MQKKILVVEDSATQAAMLVRLLQRHGFDVKHVEDGKAALDYIKNDRRHSIDLIVSDVVMPEMDGFELCRTVKADPDWKNVPIVLLTSLSEPDEIIKGLESRCDSFILKPYDTRNLILRLNALLGKRRKATRSADQERLAHAGAILAGRSAPVPASAAATAATTASGIPIRFAGRMHYIDSDHQQVLDLLISVLEETYLESRQLRDRQMAQHRSRHEGKYLREILVAQMATHPDGALVVDADGVVLYANPPAAQVFGVDVDDLAGQRLELPVADGTVTEADIPQSNGNSMRVRLAVSPVVWEGAKGHFVSLHSQD